MGTVPCGDGDAGLRMWRTAIGALCRIRAVSAASQSG